MCVGTARHKVVTASIDGVARLRSLDAGSQSVMLKGSGGPSRTPPSAQKETAFSPQPREASSRAGEVVAERAVQPSFCHRRRATFSWDQGFAGPSALRSSAAVMSLV